MTDTFETTLANIISQKSDFESRGEKAVEMAIVLPLLKLVGWNTENVSEIYPQHETSDGGKVDFDLQIDGESRILIEVKRWKYDLNDGDEEQLNKYCQSTKPHRPKLAILTSGRVWRLYLAPTANKGKNSLLKKFEEIDLTITEPSEVESSFNQFLARGSMVDFKSTLKAATDLYRKLQDFQEQKRLLIKAWNELAKDKTKLAQLLEVFAEREHITTSHDNVMRFLNSLPGDGDLVNEVPTKPKPLMPPASFSILASPTGQKKRPHTVESPIGWNKLLLQICELMQKQHSESFRRTILSMTGWFAESESSKFSIPIGDVGVYVRKENAAYKIRDACYEIVAKFGYSRDSLEIMDSSGNKIPEQA